VETLKHMHRFLEWHRQASRPEARLDLNVLPERYRQGRLSPGQAALIILLVFLIALVVPVYQAVSRSREETSSLQLELNALNSQVQAIHSRQQRLAQLQTEIAKYEAVLGARGMTSHYFQLVVTIAEVVPGVYLRNVSINQNQIVLSGTADSYEPAFDFFTALEQRTEDFSSVKWGQIGLTTGADEVPFGITIDLAQE